MVKSIKTVAVNMVLSVTYILLLIVIMMPLASERAFGSAEKLVSVYKWREAEPRFREAISIDPFDARHIARFGRFLLLQARYLDYKEQMLESAERYLERAINLDPLSAGYRLDLGLIKLRKGLIDDAFKDFREALRYDPNGFDISYSIGLAGISSWKDASEDMKAFVSDRLKFAMRLKPSCANDVYSALWRATKDIRVLRNITPDSLKAQAALYDFITSYNLWQFRKEQASQVEKYLGDEDPDMLRAEKMEKTKRLQEIRDKRGAKYSSDNVYSGTISAGDWFGKTPDGQNEYKNGNMYWSGTMYAFVNVPQGDNAVKVQARGQHAGGIDPYMIIEMDGGEALEAFVDNAEWENYEFNVNGDGGIKILSVTFVNDWNDLKSADDRNLFIGNAEVVKLER